MNNDPEHRTIRAQSDRFLDALRALVPPHNAYVPVGAKQ